MQDTHSADDLLDFLTHAAERGLMPAATAQALSVATRNVVSVLDDAERADLPLDDLDGIIRRFTNKRARDFNPATLKEYGRRLERAVSMYLRWREDPASFTVKTRATKSPKKKERGQPARQSEAPVSQPTPGEPSVRAVSDGSGYGTAFPVRPGQVVTIGNVPHDLTAAEAERLAQFIRLLAPVQ